MIPKATRIVLLALAFAGGTVALGWVAVPVLGGVWGILSRPGSQPGWTAGLSAALGWVVLLLWTVTQGPVGAVAARLAGILELPTLGVYLLTLAFPLVVAWSAAGAVAGVKHWKSDPT